MTLSPDLATHNIISQVTEMSIIIPVFNQESKVRYSLEKIEQTVELIFGNYELIVVNDGSTDATLPILRDISKSNNHMRILSYTPNRGKGYAVRHGVLHSRGQAVMFLDGDLDISPESIKEYVEKLTTSDLVIASKRHPRSSVSIPKSRALLSRAFNFLIRLATGLPQKDTQAGFKVGNGEIMRAIFRNISVKRYAFDVELFTIASMLGLKIQEMPVIMKIDRKFKTKEIINMLVDVIRISYKYRLAHTYQREYMKQNTLKTLQLA
jgi:dolichol-phosphate mannosyltransferase